MFNERQLLTLGLLLQRINETKDLVARHALATVFSDSLRYQNLLCRYDTYALKCQDIFSVHGFPVGLIQCENNVIGIPGIGSGSFRHFVEKYDRAKAYCEQPFETVKTRGRKRLQPVVGERIEADLVTDVQELNGSRKALLAAGSIEDASLPGETVDAILTDPPYFDNVQYAELMDFCYVWLRLLLGEEFPQFRNGSTRSYRELTGNDTSGKDLVHFTDGLSRVFRCAARWLKPSAPFAFTYHHRDLAAYVPVIVAILDAGLMCTGTLPCPAEMTASLHIHGTGSSVIDSIIVCRHGGAATVEASIDAKALQQRLAHDFGALAAGGIRCTRGDLQCLAFGHLTRATVQSLHAGWDASRSVETKLAQVEQVLKTSFERCDVGATIRDLVGATSGRRGLPTASEGPQLSLFDQVGHGAQ
jgi:adenine-specific DNA methylase